VTHKPKKRVDPNVIDFYIDALNNINEYVRNEATNMLVQIGTQAVEPVVASVLMDRINNRFFENRLAVLRKTGDPKAITSLIATFKISGTETQLKIMNMLITLGMDEAIPALIRVLNSNGNKSMALMFANCGNIKLYDAAYDWAEKHGYSLYVDYNAPNHSIPWGGK
jgi:hypothetical protein